MLELTADNALDYLRHQGWIDAGPARVEPLGWGVSNLVLRVVTTGLTFVLKQSRPQLRTRDTWISDIERIYREQEVMELLHALLPAPIVPEILVSDRANFVFAMSHAPQPSQVWKETLLAGQVDLEVAERAGKILGQMHECTARTPSLVERFADHHVFEQLRIEPFYLRIQERRPEVAEAIEPIVNRLRTRKLALCHGDFSPKNILTHAQGFTLVDYETAHFGDPTMDLGFFLSHLMLKAIKFFPVQERYFELTRAFWRGYEQVIGFRSLEQLQREAIEHMAACIMARIDGTSPVDYLPEESKREAVRRLGRRLLWERPANWETVLGLCETCLNGS
ncbi:MAG TPA: aminoglycoside phosphotransferase family protein [Gemmataceae bacterium]|nr:aminoglycoside phosphotransferase family protein [Gemmataceae bacterium]